MYLLLNIYILNYGSHQFYYSVVLEKTSKWGRDLSLIKN